MGSSASPREGIAEWDVSARILFGLGVVAFDCRPFVSRMVWLAMFGSCCGFMGDDLGLHLVA